MQGSSTINLILLPYAGASFYAYRDFPKVVPPRIRCTAIDLPGHGRRLGHPLLTRAHDMVEDILYQIRDLLEMPYAFYGHSMGATLGYLLARRILRGATHSPPLHLFLSGRTGPTHEREVPLHTLQGKAFVDALVEYGGMPQEVLAHRELLEIFLPILRADLQALETYSENHYAPLPIPITVLLGEDDSITRGREVQWRAMTNRDTVVKTFPGGHFFFYEHLPEIARIIAETLSPVIP